MLENGDDLEIPRDIEFNLVFPSREVAERFKACLDFPQAHSVVIERGGVVPDFPWDVIVSVYMCPTHAEISLVEAVLGKEAQKYGGKNDGWGCFQAG